MEFQLQNNFSNHHVRFCICPIWIKTIMPVSSSSLECELAQPSLFFRLQTSFDAATFSTKDLYLSHCCNIFCCVIAYPSN